MNHRAVGCSLCLTPCLLSAYPLEVVDPSQAEGSPKSWLIADVPPFLPMI